MITDNGTEKRIRPNVLSEIELQLKKDSQFTYQSWISMWQRCIIPSTQNFKNYGGRGIVVCEDWRSFEQFVKDMGFRLDKELSIDRIDGQGNYEPGNCRWATRKEQRLNQKNVIPYELPSGELVTMWDASKMLRKLNGFSPEWNRDQLKSGKSWDELAAAKKLSWLYKMKSGRVLDIQRELIIIGRFESCQWRRAIERLDDGESWTDVKRYGQSRHNPKVIERREREQREKHRQRVREQRLS